MRFLFASFVIGSFAFTACAASSEPEQQDLTDEGPAADEEELAAKKCGGIAGLHCPAGYDCITTAHHPDAGEPHDHLAVPGHRVDDHRDGTAHRAVPSSAALRG